MTTDAAPSPTVIAAESCPIAYFEGTAAIGHMNGIYTVGLTVGRPITFSDGGVPLIITSVAMLKGNRQALEALRSAIDGALLLGAKAEGEVN